MKVPERGGSYRPRHRKNSSKHFGGNTERSQHDTGVEIDIGIKFFLDKIRIFQRDTLQFHRQFKQPVVVQIQFIEYLMTGLTH